MKRSERPDKWIDDLAKRNARYSGDFDALVEKYELLTKNPRTRSQAVIANGECARLPQELTDVGWTGRWRRGPRVLDLAFLLPGTVIANFKLVDGDWKFPNEHGYHAGLFDRFQNGKVLAYGLPCEFTIFDQYNGERGPKPAGLRPMSILPDWYKQQYPRYNTPSNRADDFYVVVVP
jgi:hypothetical protein